MSPPPPPPRTAGPTDAALVVSARAGEAWAYEALFRRHVGMAHGLAARLLGSEQDAEDVVQDACVAVLSGLDRLREPQAFASFLATVVVRRVRNLLRRRRLARRLGLLPPPEPMDPSKMVSADAPPDAMAELSSIYRVIQALPTDERLALVLRRVEGVPLEQVASMLGCSLATAKRRVAAAEAFLERESQPRAVAALAVRRAT
jgi:RNA polymerase sigma-70 factor (ECF subfamily)